MSSPIFISTGGDAQGPYDMGQLRSMWNTGQLTANTLYWSEDGNEWRGIAELRLGEVEAKPAARPEASLSLAGGANASEVAGGTPVVVKPDSINATQWVMIVAVFGFLLWVFVDTMWGKPWVMWVAAPFVLVGLAVLVNVMWGLFVFSGMKLTDRELWRTSKWKAASLLLVVVGLFVFIQMPERILGEEFIKEHGIKAVYAVIAFGAAFVASLAWTMFKANRRKSG